MSAPSVAAPLVPFSTTVHARCKAPVLAGVPRIVAIGGGTGLPAVLRGLANAMGPVVYVGGGARSADTLSAIVTVTDDGGSSGRLRRDLGMLPPGDIRNCLAALTGNSTFERLLTHRFAAADSWLDGHAVGNLMLAALAQMTGNFAEAIDELARLLKARGSVFPSTLEDVMLRGELENGETIEGETAIVDSPAAIRRMALARPARPYPGALRALINADVIVVGPGSLYTSILPNLLIDGVTSTLSAVQAIRVYVANLMTEPGETDGYSLDDHLRVLREHTGRDLFDYVLVNSTPPTESQITRYRGKGAELIPVVHTAEGPRLIRADLLDTSGDQVRHDPAKMADAILRLAHPQRDS
jgi:uncharacterized cofD-like protein